MLIGLAVLFATGVPLIAALDAKGAAIGALAADLVLTAVMLGAVRRVGDGSVGVETGYLIRYAATLAVAAGVALAVLAVAPAAVAAAAAAAAFAVAAFSLRLVPSELMALIPGR
jgi:hypothetical protein